MTDNAPTGPIRVDEVSSLVQRWYVLIIMMLVLIGLSSLKIR